MNEETVTFSNKGGPCGVGDPDDMRLRKVELDVLIPKKMREIAKIEKCADEVAAFTKCGSESGLGVVLFCRRENQDMKDCMSRWYQDKDFKERCKQEYLTERSEYRRTGVTQKKLRSLRELRHEASLEERKS